MAVSLTPALSQRARGRWSALRATFIVKRLLAAAGCRFERPGKGDHEIGFSPIPRRRFPVDQKILSRHTGNAVLRQAGLPKAF